MIRIFSHIIILFLYLFFFKESLASHMEAVSSLWPSMQQDSIEKVSEEVRAKINRLNTVLLTSDSIAIGVVQNNPYHTVGSFLIGQSPGVYVQRPSGEPGSYQNILLRGISAVQFSNREIVNNQATVYINGVPMGHENAFAYNIQRYEFTRIGPSTDYLSSIDISSIASIEIIKDPIRLAELGPLASNGAIWITTFGGKTGPRELSINGYYGVSTKPAVSPFNAEYENLFRQHFYKSYASESDNLKYPVYLADVTNPNYYGSSDWKDLYYSAAAFYTIDLSLKGGSDRANFGFFGSHTKNAVSSDRTNLKRYNALFNVNMLPFTWLTVSSYINARRMDRVPNTNLRDRYSEMAYLPDLSTPLSPNKSLYKQYMNLYNQDVVDDNISNHVTGRIGLSMDLLPNLNLSSSFSLDYNEGIRDLFYPSSLMETINYMSTYFGYTQRYVFSNKAGYSFSIGKNSLSLALGSDYSADLFRYNFARAYDGPNDYIKLNVVEGDPKKAEYLSPKGGLRVLRYVNKEQFNIHSIYGRFGVNFSDVLALNSVLRWDGSSAVQPDKRWLFTPSLGLLWHVDKQLDWKNKFSVQTAYSRIGKPVYSSRHAVGPQYDSNLGWTEDPSLSSYFGFAGVSRTYSYGWTGYDLDWAYSDRYELTISNSFFNQRLSSNISLYQRDDNDQIALMPIPFEFGYTGEYKNGLSIRNRGVDLRLTTQLLPNSVNRFSWSTDLLFNWNRNELTKLPGAVRELQIENRLLRVGEPIDRFWLYENQGIYTHEEDIPKDQNGVRLNNNGVPFAVGDARWKDQNGDNIINDDDKLLKGRYTPKFYGGFNHALAYRGVDLNLAFSYALGLNALNQRASYRYDFINNENNNTIGAVREIFHWQQDLDIRKYPIYNVWSGTNPYRVDQDLFLENASYLKLRSASLGYDLTSAKALKKALRNFRKVYFYLTANNLFTLSKFTGNDPELVNFNGVYDGYGIAFTRTFTLGVKLDL